MAAARAAEEGKEQRGDVLAGLIGLAAAGAAEPPAPTRGSLRVPVPPAVAEAMEEDTRAAVEALAAAARRHTWYWETYPVDLPPSFIDNADALGIDYDALSEAMEPLRRLTGSGGRETAANELRELTRDYDGDRKKLTPQMRREVRKRGEFDIPSVAFEGQSYTFRLNRGIQTGSEPAKENYKNALSLAAGTLVWVMPKSLFSADEDEIWGVPNAMRHLWEAVVNTLDLLVGWRAMKRPYRYTMEEIADKIESAYAVSTLKRIDDDDTTAGGYTPPDGGKADGAAEASAPEQAASSEDLVAGENSFLLVCPACSSLSPRGAGSCSVCTHDFGQAAIGSDESNARGAVYRIADADGASPPDALVDARMSNHLLHKYVVGLVEAIEEEVKSAFTRDEIGFQTEQLRRVVEAHVADSGRGGAGAAAGGAAASDAAAVSLHDAVEAWNRFDGPTQDRLSAEVLRACATERERRFIDAVMANDELQRRAPGLAHFLVARAVVTRAQKRADYEHKAARREEEARVAEQVRANHSILSRFTPWAKDKEAALMRKWDARHEGDVLESTVRHLDAVTAARPDDEGTRHIQAARYLLRRRAQWKRSQREATIAKLSAAAASEPQHEVEFERRIWQPKNWLVNHRSNGDGTLSYYLVTKMSTITVTSRWPGWRLIALFVSMFTWVSNVAFALIVNMFFGPLSLQALFRCAPYHPEKEIDAETGNLVPSSLSVDTYTEHIAKLWRSVSEARARFEAREDAGLLGKSCERIFVLLWHYVVRGAVGTIGIGILFPVFCVVNVVLSLVLLLTSVAWVPCISVTAYAFNVLLHDWRAVDWEYPRPMRAKHYFPYCLPIVSILLGGYLGGVLRLLFSLFVGLVGAPFVSLVVAVFSTLWAVVVCFWDSLCFCCVVRPLARQPYVDTCIARRIKGPGMASAFRFHLPANVALVVIHARLELQELELFVQSHRAALAKPAEAWREWVARSLWPFLRGTSPGTNTQINAFTEERLTLLQDAAKERRAALQRFATLTSVDSYSLSGDVYNMVSYTDVLGQPAVDLDNTVRMTAEMLRRFVPRRVLGRMQTDDERATFWSSKTLAVDDWAGLARRMLGEAFGTSFLTPFEQHDKTLKLEVDHLRFDTYVDAVMGGRSDDLDSVRMPALVDASAVESKEWHDSRAPVNAAALAGASGNPLTLKLLPEDRVDERDGAVLWWPPRPRAASESAAEYGRAVPQHRVRQFHDALRSASAV